MAQRCRIWLPMQETLVLSWVSKIPWRRKQKHAPAFLPGKIPWIVETGGLQSMGSQVRHDLSDSTTKIQVIHSLLKKQEFNMCKEMSQISRKRMGYIQYCIGNTGYRFGEKTLSQVYSVSHINSLMTKDMNIKKT